MRFLSKPRHHDPQNWYKWGHGHQELGRCAPRTTCSKASAGGGEARMLWSGRRDATAALVRGKRLAATNLPLRLSRSKDCTTDTGLGIRPRAFPVAICLNTELTALFFNRWQGLSRFPPETMLSIELPSKVGACCWIGADLWLPEPTRLLRIACPSLERLLDVKATYRTDC